MSTYRPCDQFSTKYEIIFRWTTFCCFVRSRNSLWSWFYSNISWDFRISSTLSSFSFCKGSMGNLSYECFVHFWQLVNNNEHSITLQSTLSLYQWVLHKIAVSIRSTLFWCNLQKCWSYLMKFQLHLEIITDNDRSKYAISCLSNSKLWILGHIKCQLNSNKCS